MPSRQFVVADANSLDWTEVLVDHIGRPFHIKGLFSDPDTGMSVTLLRYPAGLLNPLHTHPCGHGMYIVEGELRTHRGIYGPGNFVWFPEGEIMEHGATAEGDVVALFITNKPFQIDYVDSSSPAMH